MDAVTKEVDSAAKADPVESLRETAVELEVRVREAVKENPWTTLGAGALVGFVVAGGLTPKVLWRALGIGGRVLFATLIEQAVRPERDR